MASLDMSDLLKTWNKLCSLRFIIIGGWNTVFSYLAFSGLYYVFGGGWGDIFVQLFAGFLGITHAFIMHKFVTYRSCGVWWHEYLKFYVVYGLQIIVQAILFWVCTTWLGYNGYIVQFTTTLLLTIVSYWAHKCYSFAACDANCRSS